MKLNLQLTRTLVVPLTVALMAGLIPSCMKSKTLQDGTPIKGEWEYRVFDFALQGNMLRVDLDAAPLSKRAQEIANEGWEYVGPVLHADGITPRTSFVLYRKKL